jgi:GH25 family lysozyme M1 (1,4-beta-N-acetylmuramidase)
VDYEISYPVAFDMEYVDNDTARVEALSKEEKTKIAITFLDTVKATGYIPMVYGDKEWLIKRVDLSKLKDYDVWLSQPGDIPDYPYQFTMWQYDDNASVDGIAQRTNLSISFVDYGEK